RRHPWTRRHQWTRPKSSAVLRAPSFATSMIWEGRRIAAHALRARAALRRTQRTTSASWGPGTCGTTITTWSLSRIVTRPSSTGQALLEIAFTPRDRFRSRRHPATAAEALGPRPLAYRDEASGAQPARPSQPGPRLGDASRPAGAGLVSSAPSRERWSRAARIDPRRRA